MDLQEKQGTSLLKLEKDAPNVYEKLQALKRTGWVESGVENPESVKEHTIALLELANTLSEDLTEEENDQLLDMLEVHDWPEAIHGDEVILDENPEDRKHKKQLKFEAEKMAMEKICADVPNGDQLLELWLRFETSDDPAASFGRQLDKYQAVDKALEYEKEQGIELFEEFYTYSINHISHPILLEMMINLKQKK